MRKYPYETFVLKEISMIDINIIKLEGIQVSMNVD